MKTGNSNFNYKKNNTKQNYNITVSTTQLRNPIIKDFFFGYNTDSAIQCDFKVSDKYFCFFLSLRYHDAFPAYIQEKLAAFKNQESSNGNAYKYLFCVLDMAEEVDSGDSKLVDNQIMNLNLKIACHDFNKAEDNFFDLDSNNSEENKNSNKTNSESKLEKLLTDLNFICLNASAAMVLCYSGYDLAQYIYSLSQMENSNSNYVEDKMKALNLEENIIEALCNVDKINKTDAGNLLSNFQDIKSILSSSSQLLSLVPGINYKKVKSITDFLEYDFNKFNINKA